MSCFEFLITSFHNFFNFFHARFVNDAVSIPHLIFCFRVYLLAYFCFHYLRFVELKTHIHNFHT
jgi:hypothetical protein